MAENIGTSEEAAEEDTGPVEPPQPPPRQGLLKPWNNLALLKQDYIPGWSRNYEYRDYCTLMLNCNEYQQFRDNKFPAYAPKHEELRTSGSCPACRERNHQPNDCPALVKWVRLRKQFQVVHDAGFLGQRLKDKKCLRCGSSDHWVRAGHANTQECPGKRSSPKQPMPDNLPANEKPSDEDPPPSASSDGSIL